MAHNPEGGGGGDQKQQQKKKKNHLLSTVWRWQLRRGFPLRRRRVQTQRLGGKKPRRRMVALVVNRKMKLKLKYVCMVKKLQECYRNLVKDMAEAGASIESFHQRFFMETTFAVPIGITFSGTLYSSRFGPDHRQPKTLFM